MQYLLGLNNSLDACAGSKIEKGAISYKLHWDIDPHQVGHLESVEITDALPEELTRIPSDDYELVVKCIEEYARNHNPTFRHFSPASGQHTMVWGTKSVFPIGTSDVYRTIERFRVMPDAPP